MFEIKKEEYFNRTVRMPSSLIERIDALANENDISFNKLVIQCCEYALENIKDKK